MQGKILSGRYELLEKIGCGGMAVVYKAKCHLLKRYVAVKVLRPELMENEEFVTRFKQESQSAASLSHSNIVNIYDVGQEEDFHYIVMEYVCGHTLKEYIQERGRLDPEEAVRICMQICSALSLAHRKQIIHRDIKPQNILIDDEGHVKVADFGIARAVTTATVTLAGANVIGSVHYFSPEQARGGYVDKKSDLYSLGIVLYEMVTGVVPFEADSAISVALMHLQEAVPPVDSLHPDIPKSIQYILEKALQKDADKRYSDAIAMLKDLRQAIAHPDGAYIQRSDPAPGDATQVVRPIRSEEKQEQEYRADRTEKKQRRFNPVLVTAAFGLFIVLLFYGAFTAGRILYQNYFQTQEVPVPRVEGLSTTAAEALLRDHGLTLGIRGTRNDREAPEGMILSQDPQPGIHVRTGSAVGVIVSEGIRIVTVPDITGKSQRDAEVELENQGLRVGEPIYAFSEYPRGHVSAQSIDPEQEVQENTLIILTISRGPEETRVQVGRYTELLEQTAKARILEDGFTVGTVHREHHDSEAGMVYRHNPAYGDYAENERPVELWVSLGPQPPRTRSLMIEYEGSDARIRLRIIRASDNAVVHDQYHAVTEDPIEVEVEGRGLVRYLIYVNGNYMQKIDINFDRNVT